MFWTRRDTEISVSCYKVHAKRVDCVLWVEPLSKIQMLATIRRINCNDERIFSLQLLIAVIHDTMHI